jgi:serine/threonine protein kinase
MKVVISEKQARVTLESSPLIEGPGMTIGRYKLRELISEGGMGLVYLAEQQEPVRRMVALKIVKPGMDTRQVIARFEAERQVLALLDHPNIARVYDAGTTETGRPYFVMEYVKGQSITEYCDQHKTGIEDRLKLFRQVCEGVQHAHQKGIIHRDIKPSNILVTVEGDRAVPKIIDFGIAKAVTQSLTERTLFTHQGQLLGTPEYMSPEQVDMATQDIDTRSDIYSLGVVLYQLLAGVLPFGQESFEQCGFAEIQRVIQEVDPPNPSTALTKLGDEAKKIAEKRKTQVVPLARRLHRELEWIPLKAMRKERVRRYRSASELADDIQNYLNGNPLLAGPETATYRVKKFVRRHTGSVATVVLVAAAIVFGLVISTAMYLRSEKALQREAAARAEAERQAHISQAVNEFLNKDLLTSFDPYKAKGRAITEGRAITVIEILDNAAEKLEGKFKDAPLIEASIRDTLAMTYMSLGKSAKPHLERALQLRRDQLGEEHPDTLTSMDHLGLHYMYQFDFKEAETLRVKVLEIRRRVLGEEHPDTLDSMNHLGWVYNMQGRYNEAEPLWVKTLEICRRVLGEEHPDTLWAMHNLGLLHIKRGRNNEAESLLVKTLEIQRRVWGAESLDTVGYMDELGWLYYTQGRYSEAEPLLVKPLEVWRRVLGEEHPNTLRGMGHVGKLYCMQGRYNEAEPLFVKELEILRHAGEPLIGMLDAIENITMLVEHLGPLGIERYKAGAYEEAAATLKRVDEYRRTVLNKESQLSEIAYIAMALRRLGHNQEAQASLEQLRGMFEDGKYISEEHYLYEAEQIFAGENSKGYLAWERIKAGKLDEASQLAEELGASEDPNIAGLTQSIAKTLARALYRRIRSGPPGKSYGEVIADYEAAVHLVPNCAQAFNDLAWLWIACPIAELHDGVKAVKAATKACELTNWKNPDYVSTLAAAYSEAGDFAATIKWQKEAIGLLPLLPEDNRAAWQRNYEARLKLYQSGKAYSRNFPAEKTVVWLKFDEAKNGNVIDSSGNNLQGKLIGDAKIISDPERGSVLCLDGDGDYVDGGNNPVFDSMDFFTAAAWIKVKAFDKDWQALFTKGGGIEFARNGKVPLAGVCGTMDVNDGKWHHFAEVCDGMKFYVYVDGKLDNWADALGLPKTTNEFPVLIGENAEERGHYWNGLIDDVRLYSYALSEAEVKALYADKEPSINNKESK